MRPSGASPFTSNHDRLIERRHHALSPRRLRHRFVEEFFRPVFAPIAISDKISDPIQRVTVCFARMQGDTVIELVEPLGENSPIDTFIGSSRGGVYHLCYEVEDLATETSRVAGKSDACPWANPCPLPPLADAASCSC
jgi:glyoxalase/bleomycin resistance protein/dioxygenase superfamily protein